MHLLPSYYGNTEPEARLPEVLEEITMPSLTIGFNLESNSYTGLIDKREALIQAIYLMLNTEKSVYPIFPHWYGLETKDLYGKSADFVASELERRIKECLLTDDRISEVRDFSYVIEKGNLSLNYTIISIFGDIKIRGEELDA